MDKNVAQGSQFLVLYVYVDMYSSGFAGERASNKSGYCMGSLKMTILAYFAHYIFRIFIYTVKVIVLLYMYI